MVNKIEISPEVAKLAQHRTRAIGTGLNNELARSIAQEAIYNADPEAGLMLDEEAAFSSQDALVAVFGVNDIVVNGIRLDVRTVDEEGRISLSRPLVGSQYMTAGTVAVEISGNLSGKVVGFVAASDWESVERKAGDQQIVFVTPKREESFDLTSKLNGIKPVIQQQTKAEAVKAAELATFIANRAELSLDKQRGIINGTLCNRQSWPEVAKVVSTWARSRVQRVLSDAAIWNSRLERVLDVAAAKCKRLSREDVRKLVAKTGETLGGQPDSPAFRKALLNALTRAELSHCLAGAALKKAGKVAEAVLSGRAISDAVKDVAGSEVAVKIATQIKRQRQKVSNFVDANAQEIAGAFQQLALKPAYATHSVDPASGMESINEALSMLDAGELAENLKDLDQEIANI